MTAWLKRLWSWLKADLSGKEEWVVEEEEEREELEEEAPLSSERQNRQRRTDGFREVG